MADEVWNSGSRLRMLVEAVVRHNSNATHSNAHGVVAWARVFGLIPMNSEISAADRREIWAQVTIALDGVTAELDQFETAARQNDTVPFEMYQAGIEALRRALDPSTIGNAWHQSVGHLSLAHAACFGFGGHLLEDEEPRIPDEDLEALSETSKMLREAAARVSTKVVATYLGALARDVETAVALYPVLGIRAIRDLRILAVQRLPLQSTPGEWSDEARKPMRDLLGRIDSALNFVASEAKRFNHLLSFGLNAQKLLGGGE